MDDFLYNLRRESDKRNRRQQGGPQQYRGPDRRTKDPRRGFSRRNEAADQLPEIKSLLETLGENQKLLLANDKRKTAALEQIAASLRLLSGDTSPIKAIVEEHAASVPVETEPEVPQEAADEATAAPPEPAGSGQPDEAQQPNAEKEKPLRSKREDVRKIALALREEGKTYKEIAQYLDDEKVPTFSGKGGWHAPTIHKLCK